MLWQEEHTTFNVRSSGQQKYLYLWLLKTMDDKNYVRILVFVYVLIDYFIFGSYSCHAMLDLNKKKIVLIYKRE